MTNKLGDNLNIDLKTFGDSGAEVTIAKILNAKGDRRLSKYVQTAMSDFNKHLKNIQFEREDLGTQRFLYRILKTSVTDYVAHSPILDRCPELKTYMVNSLVKRLRKKLVKKTL